MVNKIKTDKYTFSICLDEVIEPCIFEIKASCNITSKKSGITNLNIIISELIEPTINIAEVPDSFLQIDKSKGIALYNNAIDLFNDRYWLKHHLIPAIEDDRVAGEWS